MALSDNLVAYWKLDEASGTRADSFSNNNLSDNNTVGSATGKINLAADFVASSSEYLSIADNVPLSFGDEALTITYWANGDTLSGTQSLLGKWASSGSVATCEYASRFVGADFAFRVGDGSTNGTVSSTNYSTQVAAFSTGTWYYIMVWHDPSANEIGIRINADDAHNNVLSWTTGILDGAASFSIGRMGDFDGQYWDGLIDEVGIWRRVLTAGENTTLYNGGAGLPYSDINPTAASVNRSIFLMNAGKPLPGLLIKP